MPNRIGYEGNATANTCKKIKAVILMILLLVTIVFSIVIIVEVFSCDIGFYAILRFQHENFVDPINILYSPE